MTSPSEAPSAVDLLVTGDTLTGRMHRLVEQVRADVAAAAPESAVVFLAEIETHCAAIRHGLAGRQGDEMIWRARRDDEF